MNYTISTEPGATSAHRQMALGGALLQDAFAGERRGRKRPRAHRRGEREAGKDVRVGDIVEIEIERIVWQVEVLGVCDVRGPASVAQTLYAETRRAGRSGRRNRNGARRIASRPPELHGRPTKRDRRTIDKFSGGGLNRTVPRSRERRRIRSCVVDGAGHADGRGARNEYQSDHRDSKGQFHGTPLGTGRIETGKGLSG